MMELTEQENKEYYARWCFAAVVYKEDFPVTIENEEKKETWRKQRKKRETYKA